MSNRSQTAREALIVGATGIAGRNLAAHLKSEGWTVHGLSRRPIEEPGIHALSADLQDVGMLHQALKNIAPSHVFLTSWLRQPTEAGNIAVNSAMVRNLLAVTSTCRSVRHVALVTGLKHYLGPFEAYGKGVLPAVTASLSICSPNCVRTG